MGRGLLNWQASSAALVASLTFSPAASFAAPATSAADNGKPIATAPPVTVIAGAPKGFEDLDQAVTTLFDLTFEGRRVGTFEGVLDGAQFRFTDPQAVIAALGKQVVAADVLRLIGQPMPANSQLACPPGRTDGCGILAPGLSGVIADPMTFAVTLFLGREYLTAAATGPRYMPAPISGPSLIQNIDLVAAGVAGANGTGSQGGDIGAVLNTTASNGRDSVVADTFLDSLQGSYLQDSYAQHISTDWRAAAGILYANASQTLASGRMAGVEIGSFSRTRLDNDQFVATPVQVALARQATVEIYRNGALVFARTLQAGLQTVDTSDLPSGSYPIRVVVRDGGQIVSDTTQVFVKASDLPPPGKTNFMLRAGAIGPDSATTEGAGGHVEFLPAFNQGFLQASASHRLGTSTAGTLAVTVVGSSVYPEADLQTYYGFLRGDAGAAIGPQGSYSAFGGLTASFKSLSGTLTLRSVNANSNLTTVSTANRYEPFYGSENDVDTSLQFPLPIVGGSGSVQASYVNRRDIGAYYNYGFSYSRPLPETRFGTPRLQFSVIKTDQETRGTFTITLFRRVGRRSTLEVETGVDTISGSIGGDRNGVSPVVDATYSRTDTVGRVDVQSSEGVLLDETQRRVFTDVQALSPYGTAQGNLSYGQDDTSRSDLEYNTDIHTGFAIGGGVAKWGLRQAGEAVVLMDIEADKNLPKPLPAADAVAASADAASPTSSSATVQTPVVTQGGYRVTVNDQPYDRIDVGQMSAIGLSAFSVYAVTLAPDGAPPFDIDLTPRQVPLYPGNVVFLRWKGEVVMTLFGRLVDAAGAPMGNARIDTEGDRTTTDDAGYFTVTARTNEDLSVRTANGQSCVVRSPQLTAKASDISNAFRRLGQVTCGK